MLERLKRLLVEPRDAWIAIAAEPSTAQSLYTSWIMILAAIGPVALLATGHYPLQLALAQYVRSLIGTFVLALVVDALAPSFGGRKDFVGSLKLVGYSLTLPWLAGVFNLFGALGDIVRVVAMIYALYTFFVGAPLLGKSSTDKAVPFTLVAVLCALVLFFLARFAFTGITMTAPVGSGLGMPLR